MLYVSSPSNPTGRIIPDAVLEDLVAWASDNDLWVISDQVYEDLNFTGTRQNVLAMAPERVITAHSFSKTWAMAGTRCGWIVAPEAVIEACRKHATHLFYSTPTAAQVAAHNLLDSHREEATEWLETMRAQYLALGQEAAQRLGVDAPDGSSFLFLEVSAHLDERGLMGFLEDCADRGLFLAPGPSFGPYPNHVRVCFTSVEPERTRRGLAILSQMLGKE